MTSVSAQLPARGAVADPTEALAGPRPVVDPGRSMPVTQAWLTAQVRPAGSFGRRDVGRLRVLLDALSGCASVVVVDLGAARLRSPRAVAVIEDAARRLDRAGGCLVCVNADPEVRERLCHLEHAVVAPGS